MGQKLSIALGELRRFADIPAQGQISVWHFPRPPDLVSEVREIVVRWGEREVARTCTAWAVRETAHPPTFYLPLAECIAFYASDLDCSVGGAKVITQPGGFYSGWITPELTGPFKGVPGSSGW